MRAPPGSSRSNSFRSTASSPSSPWCRWIHLSTEKLRGVEEATAVLREPRAAAGEAEAAHHVIVSYAPRCECGSVAMFSQRKRTGGRGGAEAPSLPVPAARSAGRRRGPALRARFAGPDGAVGAGAAPPLPRSAALAARISAGSRSRPHMDAAPKERAAQGERRGDWERGGRKVGRGGAARTHQCPALASPSCSPRPGSGAPQTAPEAGARAAGRRACCAPRRSDSRSTRRSFRIRRPLARGSGADGRSW